MKDNFMNKLDGHSKSVLSSVLFPHPDSKNSAQKYLITAGSSEIDPNTNTLSGVFKIWDIKTGKCENTFYINNSEAAISALAVVARGIEMEDDYLITGSEDGQICFWKMEESESFNFVEIPVSLKNSHKKNVLSIAVYTPRVYYNDINSPLSRCLFISVGFDKNEAFVWDFDNIIAKATDTFIGRLGEGYKSSFSQSGKTIQRSIYNTCSNIKIFSSDGETPKVSSSSNEVKHTDGILSAAIYIPKTECVGRCDKGRCDCKPLIITGSWDKTIIIWNLQNLEGLISLKGHTKAVNSVFIFDPEPNYPEENYYSKRLSRPGGSSPILISGSLDQMIIIWDLLEEVKINKLPIKKESLNKNSDFTLTADVTNNSYKLINKNNKVIEVGHSAEIKSLFVFDSSSEKNRPQIISCDSDGHIIFWDLLSGHKIRSINYSDYFKSEHSIIITSVIAYCHSHENRNNENFILISCSKDTNCNLILWDFSADRQYYKKEKSKDVTILKIYDPKDGQNNPISIIADIDGNIRFWDIVKNRELMNDLEKHPKRVNYIAIHPDINYSIHYDLYMASCDGDQNIIFRKIKVTTTNETVNEVTNTRRIFKLKQFFYTLDFVSVPNYNDKDTTTTYLVQGGGRDISTKLWNIKTLIEFTHDCSTFATKIEEDSDNNSFIGKPDLEIPPNNLLHSDLIRCIVSYSNPSEKDVVYMVTSSYDKTTIVWILSFTRNETLSCKKKHTLKGHTDKVFTIAIYRSDNKPYIITGGFDGKVIIWNSSFEMVKELTDNPDSVTSIDVIESETSPLLVTTGIGKLILLYKLDTSDFSMTKLVKKLVGHSDRVCSLAVYNPTINSTTREPILVSGGDDKSFRVWRDCFQISETMPTQATVREAFDFDLKAETNWPLMRELTKQYELSLWIENSNLYYDVLLKLTEETNRVKRIEFFKIFLSAIKKTIRYTSKTSKYKSLLRCAIEEVDDGQVLQIIIDCLLENINKDITDPLTQRLYHPSYFIGCDDILFLGKKYPSLFINFVSRIKLIKSSNILNKKDTKLKIHDPLRIIISSSIYNWKTDMWKNIILNRKIDNILNVFRSTDETKREVVSYYLPLVNAGSREMLNAFVDISYNEGNVEIFNGDVGRIVLKFLWEKISISHWIQFFIYLFYVTLYSYLIYKFEFLMHDVGWRGRDIANTLNWVLFSITIYYCIVEFVQVYVEHIDNRKFNYRINKTNENNCFFLFNLKFWLALIDHFKIVWNINDIIIVSLVITGTIIRLRENNQFPTDNGNIPSYQPTLSPNIVSKYPTSYPTMNSTINYPEINTIRIIYAVGTIFVYFKILYFLRPFPSSGPLVSMIVTIAKDITAFLIILLTMVCAFAQVFWLLNANSTTSLKFGSSIWHSYLYTFIYMMGQNVDPDNDFKGSVSYPLNALILVAFMLFMILLMLNLLIALMNDSFGRVREKGLAQWRLEQGWIMLEDVWTCSLNIDPFIYVLKYASDSSELVSENQLFDTETEEKENEYQNLKIDNDNHNIFETQLKKDNIQKISSSDLKEVSKTLFNESVEDKFDKLMKKMVEIESSEKLNKKLQEVEEKLDKFFKLVETKDNDNVNQNIIESDESMKSMNINNALSGLQNAKPKPLTKK